MNHAGSFTGPQPERQAEKTWCLVNRSSDWEYAPASVVQAHRIPPIARAFVL
jgi:hypothetical protein